MNEKHIDVQFPAIQVNQLSNLIGNGGFIYLAVCPACLSYNFPIAAMAGICANCGFDINHDLVKATT